MIDFDFFGSDIPFYIFFQVFLGTDPDIDIITVNKQRL